MTIKKIVGAVGLTNKAEAIAVIGRTVNNNADVLKALIEKVDHLENELKQLQIGGQNNVNKRRI